MFDADAFRDGIRQAMVMSLPNSVSAQPKFYFPDGRTAEYVDESGSPFNWGDTATQGTAPKAPIQVTCLINPRDKPMATESSIGPFRIEQADLYFFEDEWAKVSEYDRVMINGEMYHRTETLIPVTLFDATLQVTSIEVDDKR